MGTKVRMQVGGKTWLEVEVGSVKDALKELSDYAEVFSETTCGSCGSQEVRPLVRTARGYEFYEVACLACNAKLSFGQTREGDKLFPKRRDQNGDEIGKNGWHQYEKSHEQPQTGGPPSDNEWV